MFTVKAVAKYTLLPQFVPRIQTLVYSGFSYVAFFMAQIYGSVRLLPSDHPYLHSTNMGRFGIRHVIAEAARNLDFRKENIDQIIVFGMLCLGLALLVAQVALLFLAAFASVAQAGTLPTSYAGFFITPSAQDDIAFVLMDRVFGLDNFWVDVGGGQTCVAQGIECFNSGLTPDRTIYTDYARGASTALPYPWPFHEALRMMFQWYSVGMLIIAVMIFLYFIVAITAETAQSGTPFGKRFNHVWAPIRMVVAMGMLIPLNQGLNSAQWILMHAAYWGSGFATNGWILFNNEALSSGDTLMGPTNTLVATPLAPPLNTLIEFMSVVATCKESYERMYHPINDPGGLGVRDGIVIDAYLVDGRTTALGSPPTLTGTANYTTAQAHFGYGDIKIVFGEYRQNAPEEYQEYDGNVLPYCGELRLSSHVADSTILPGSWEVERNYYAMVRTLWQDASTGGFPGCNYNSTWIVGCIAQNVSDRHLAINNNPTAPLPTATDLSGVLAQYTQSINNAINNGVSFQRNSPDWLVNLTQLGWAGAAIWYNRVAELNGSLTAAVHNIPVVQEYPMVLEKIMDSRLAADASVAGEDRHRLYQGPDKPVALDDPTEQQIARAMYQTQKLWSDSYSKQPATTNIFIDAINAVFGTSGLFNIHANANAGIHPLAQLVAIGKSIIETSVRNLGYSAAAGLGGGLMNLFQLHNVGGNVVLSASKFLLQVATIGMSIGFVLYYIIPFLPFIYFFFAVGGWVKGIFEAMVGMPLWALAHIRIDGNGMPGDAAMGGYYLVLEIFLRPILIIFGFLASITIFGAQAQILHEIWPLVVSNATGFDEVNTSANANATGGIRYLRGAIDNLFFTVIYAIIVYMLGMASFKLIDQIPNHILRWMGASVSTFGDQSGDPAQNLVRNSFIGSNMLSGPAQQVMSGGGQMLSQGGQAIGNLAKKHGG